ncbi:hypothetical protein ACF0H5_023070 [Mactra antiquata]
MLKYTTALANDDGISSPTHHQDYTRRTIDVSAGTKGSTKMAIKRGGVKKILARDHSGDRVQDGAHLPPISQSVTPQNMNMSIQGHMSQDKKENYAFVNGPVKRKEIRTPYVSHINRVSDVATPYVLHTQITNFENSNNYIRENSKLSKYSGNVVEYRVDPDSRHEGANSSLQKLPSSLTPSNDRRPRGRHGRKSNSFNEHDLDRTGDLKELTIQSNQMGLSKRADRQKANAARGRDESFSIRKKIEQFRRWHEEQYREKIKRLKQEVDHQFEAEHTKATRQVGVYRDTPTSKNEASLVTEHEKVPSEVSNEKMDQDKHTPNPVSVTDTSKPRSASAKTWKTWRNANDSYAYSDVQKYIKENELMDDEKAGWIKKWILEVNKAMKDVHHESVL